MGLAFRKSTLRFTNSSSLLLIRLVLTEILQPFKNIKINKERYRRSNFSKDHRDKTEGPDPLVVEDLISYKLNERG